MNGYIATWGDQYSNFNTQDLEKEYGMQKRTRVGWTLLVTVTLCNLAFGQQKHDYPLAPMSFEKGLQQNLWVKTVYLEVSSGRCPEGFIALVPIPKVCAISPSLFSGQSDDAI